MNSKKAGCLAKQDVAGRYAQRGNMGTSDDAVYQSFYTFAENNNIGAFQRVKEYITDSTLQDTTAAIITNNNIPTRCSMEENQKIVNSIYLQHLNLRTDSTYLMDPRYIYDSTEIVTLQNVAYQNPLSGGDAVYMARVMLFMNMTDDDNAGGEKSLHWYNLPDDKAPTKEAFRLYPNPNNGKMILEYNLNEDEKGIITFYNLTGTVVNSFNFSNTASHLNIDISNISAGSYFYNVKVNDVNVKSDKLIIIK